MKKSLLTLLIIVSTISYSQDIEKSISFVEETYFKEVVGMGLLEKITIKYDDTSNEIILRKTTIIGELKNDNSITKIYLKDID